MSVLIVKTPAAVVADAKVDDPKGNLMPRKKTPVGAEISIVPVMPSPMLALPAALEQAPWRPEHSPLGASSAERWMNCPGSVALIHALTDGEGFELEDPDYRRDGTQAHALAAWCLEHGDDTDAWEGAELYPDLTEEMMSAVQVYLDFVRKLPGRERYIELKMHKPDFHPMAYGTMDFASIMATVEEADFVDYKHGEGIVVEVRENPQLMYYAYLMLGEDQDTYPDGMKIRLHICQPRAPHFQGQIRTWETTAGFIRQWAHTILRPAMERTIHDRYLSVGEWCRFCPAKLICPAMTSLSDEATYKRDVPLQTMPAEQLGDLWVKWQWLKLRGKDLDAVTVHRALGGETIPGVKVVKKRSIRQWKDGAEEAAKDKYGELVYNVPSFVGPPAVEKLPNGTAFVAEWAFTPDNGLTIDLETSSKPAVSVSPEAKYGDPAKLLEKPNV